MAKKKKITATDDADAKQRRAKPLKPFQFKKGQSGNPAGRKPGNGIKTDIKHACAAVIEEWATLLFLTPEVELEEYMVKNEGTMPRGTRVMLEQSENPEILDRLLNRIVPMPKPSEETPGKDKTIEQVLEEARRRINAQGEVTSGEAKTE